MLDFELSSRTVVSDGILLMDVTAVKDGVTIHKLLTVEDYVSLFTNNLKKIVTYQMVPRLPKEVYQAAISDRPDTFRMILHLPAKKRGLCIGEKHFFLPYPSLVVYQAIQNGSKKEYGIFATTDDELSEQSILYQYPFGNAGSGCSACFGNIVLPKLKGIEDFMIPTNAFLDGKTNYDLFQGKKIHGKELSQGELITILEGCEVYPPELLAPVNMTMKELIGKLLKQ